MSWWNDTPDFDFWESVDWLNVTTEEDEAKEQDVD